MVGAPTLAHPVLKRAGRMVTVICPGRYIFQRCFPGRLMQNVSVGKELEVDDAVTLWGLLLEVQAELQRRLDGNITKVTGLSGIWFEVLLRLARSPEQQLRPTELASMTSFSSGGTTKLVDRIERAGLVERRPDPSDRRATLIAITDAGLAALRKGLAVHVPDLHRYLVDNLTANQARDLERTLRGLRTALADQP
ncbi:MarR family transcriptional regulator [Nocardia arthritidis]|uniref:MarR family transcriptional regulator n=1 Tax=Nocardia arthritidis TaxID=228602 RepID=A0A6G9YM44_9NOCA|nr:MarR family transcriptional regulator [Nocardia arthritidis]